MICQRTSVFVFCGSWLTLLISAVPIHDKQNVSGAKNYTDFTNGKQIKLQVSSWDVCPRNMQLYQFQSEDSSNFTDVAEQICDCKPRFLYYPEHDACYPAYRRGPCKSKEYLILLEGTAKCVKNPCGFDGCVLYEGSCYSLQNIDGPCGSDGVLDVNENTFRVECLKVNVVPFLIIQTPKKDCPAGSRRNSLGVCKQAL